MTSPSYSHPRPADIAYVAKIWFDLCERRQVAGDDAVELFTELLLRYAESGRAYHDLRHIRECLEVLEENATMADDPDALRWAIFFHDAVYDTGRDDSLNVAESAEMAAGRARRAGLSAAFAHAAHKLVMATTHADDELESEDERLIADIDVVVLAWPWDVFCEYGERIRKEYSRYSAGEYREGRADFFEKMLGKPAIYLTEPFRERYEGKARKNMKRALAEIRPAA